MRICEHCGFLVEDKNKFCTHCGAEIGEGKTNIVESRKEKVQMENGQNMHLPSNDSKKGLLLGIIGLGIGFIMLIAYVESLTIANGIFSSKDFIEQMEDPELFIFIFKTIMGIVYLLLSMPSIVLGIIGLCIRSDLKAGKIIASLALVLGLVIVLVVSLTAFR